MDVMESPIERPKKHQKRFYSGKQGEHSLKTQVVLGEKTGRIICLAHEKGRTHDFKLFKKSHVRFHKLLQVIADKGYQGITKIHRLSETPIKKRTACAEVSPHSRTSPIRGQASASRRSKQPRGGKLTKEQKQYNRQLNRLRIAAPAY